MRYGLTLPLFEEWSDPRTVVALAAAAEAAGWDGFFCWDHVTWNPAWGGVPPMADPWVTLAAVATATGRMFLGPMVTPVARRRVQKLAREVVTLDHLSVGRVVLGVGLGAAEDFTAYGEPVRDRGRRLDESLEVLTRLLAGDAVDFDGEHLTVHSPPSLPRPVRGSIPIWVGGWWPNEAPFRRAARFDGVVPGKVGAERGEVLTPDDLVQIRRIVGRHGDTGFDYVASGSTSGPDDTRPVAAWAGAGATWWLESLHPFRGTPPMEARVAAGPPRLP